MILASALTTQTDWLDATRDIVAQIRKRIPDPGGQLAVVFVHPQYLGQSAEIIRSLRESLQVGCFVGCTAAGIIGNDRELERQPGMAVLVAQLSGTEIAASHITQADLEEANGASFWHYQLEVDPGKTPQFLLLSDPFSINIVHLVSALSAAFPDKLIAGGLASGGREAGSNRFWINDAEFDEGAIILALSGPVKLQLVVAQGCRPIGEPLTVTRAEKNVLMELGGRPPMLVLQEMMPELTTRDQQLAKSALFLGRVVNEYQEDYGRGDFLIRNLLGGDQKSGALVVGDLLHTGQTVQFQVRDGVTADEDIRELLAKERKRLAPEKVLGALLFACLGRGEGMYNIPNHDIRVLQQCFGPLPAAGFFCNGEIGPIGGKCYVHGFTTVVCLFTEAPPPS